MTVLPFNAVFEDSSEFSQRIARNQQLLLKGESYFDKVADPAAGSYYIEQLTEQIIQEAWKLFLEVEEMGGYLKAFDRGFIQDKIKQEANQKDMLHLKARVSRLVHDLKRTSANRKIAALFLQKDRRYSTS